MYICHWRVTHWCCGVMCIVCRVSQWWRTTQPIAIIIIIFVTLILTLSTFEYAGVRWCTILYRLLLHISKIRINMQQKWILKSLRMQIGENSQAIYIVVAIIIIIIIIINHMNHEIFIYCVFRVKSLTECKCLSLIFFSPSLIFRLHWICEWHSWRSK